MQYKMIVILLLAIGVVGSIMYDQTLQPTVMQPVVVQKEFVSLPLPTFNMRTFTGENVDMHTLKEPVILMSFMASWCSICLAEFPDMLRLVKQMNGHVALIAISIDNSQKNAEKFKTMVAKRVPNLVNQPHVYWVWDADKTVSLKKFNVIRTPETFIINSQRHIIDKIVGKYDWAGAAMRQRLNAL